MNEVANRSKEAQEFALSTTSPAAVAPLALLDGETGALLTRMFRDPRVLEPGERRGLIAQLRKAVEVHPQIVEVRVLLGMALCVDLQPQQAMELLRQAARQAPDCFIARLKFGELLMRLRICGQAAEETHIAAQLAENATQSEMARKQAATICAMLREGIERGGYQGFMARLLPLRKKPHTESLPAIASSR